MSLEGELTRLRALEAEDVDLLYVWENDPAVWGVSGTLAPFSRHTLRRFLDEQRFDLYAARQLRLVVETLDGRAVGLVDLFEFEPVDLRAGIGMLEGVLSMVPAAKVGHIGMYRDPQTLQPVTYYCKLPSDIHEREVIVLDPMLATGGSAVEAIKILKEKGAVNVKFMCVIASPEGMNALTEAHPDVQVYCAALDEKLNDEKFIVPGLGDCGDRIFGTK